jgi:two-component system sensor histidine kinase AlgZ
MSELGRLATVRSRSARVRDTLAFRLAVELAVSGGLGAGVGALVGVLAAVLETGGLEGPLILIGTLTGGVAGAVAAITGREVLPRLSGFALPLRMGLGVLALVGGALIGMVLVLWVYPRYVLHAGRYVVLVVSINGLLALVAGVLVFVYEDLTRRLAQAQEQLAAERLAQAHARERAARAELKALQARINPHFFFNALNTAAALVTEDPERAETLLIRFSGLFRYAFRKGGEADVPLEEEIAFIEDYLEIEQARFGERLSCRVTMDDRVADEAVPPLILQPLVENAVVHGRDPETGQGLIEVMARPLRDGGAEIEIRDHGPGPGRAATGELPRGHALENVSARVLATRGGELIIEAATDGPGTRVRVVFPPGNELEDEEET